MVSQRRARLPAGDHGADAEHEQDSRRGHRPGGVAHGDQALPGAGAMEVKAGEAGHH